MDTLIIDRHDIRRLVDSVGLDTLMRELITRLKTSFASFQSGDISTPARSGFSYHRPQLGLVEWMPAMQTGGPVCVKIVGYHPSNPSTLNLPTILSTTSLYDTRTGHLLGLADATFLTALRTGAASAVATSWLAQEDSKVLGLIGCGAQAVTQAHAISLALPKLQEILFFDTDSSTMTSLPARLAPLRLKASAKAAALDQLMPKVDIICTATSVDVAGGPVFTEGTEKSSLHINAVGSDFPGKTEVPLALLRRARVCPDFRDQAIAEGECQQLRPDEIGVDLATIAGNPEDFAHYRDEQTVFDSTGWAVEDLAAMEMVMGYAEELQLGQRVELESVFEDPMNPYEFDAPAPLIAHASSF